MVDSQFRKMSDHQGALTESRMVGKTTLQQSQGSWAMEVYLQNL